MNATLPRPDEDFARTLRDRLDAVAPTVLVDTSRVVPAARRARRRRRVTALVACATVLTAGVGWVAQPWADREPQILPATDPPSTPPDASPAPGDAAPTLGPGWPDAPYWHLRREIHEVESNGDEHVNVLDEWFGNDRPGLAMNDGDLESAIGVGLHPWGREMLLDGERVDLGWGTFYALPTDPAELEAVLRDNVAVLYQEPNPREDAVLQLAGSFIGRTPAPPALRDALWTVMTNQPTATALGEVRDRQGRVGVGLESVITTGGEGDETVQTQFARYVYDPVERRLLEVSGAVTSGPPEDAGEVVFTSWDTYLEEGPVDVLPKEPRLEDSHCRSWEDC
ncbi:hypothetical protein JOE63_000196 [Cellulosimicrobium cellulans]|uniref:hypothetical protein n=1 Tax=Cellulosimicrobium cellulans TaxID=1710 RepID=UPI00195E9004|nr:hypothetical protein [Cellulosimicrobium cellulans]MBM7817719.1 hypothetical protein [Cellulosimicrobium cellulans]